MKTRKNITVTLDMEEIKEAIANYVKENYNMDMEMGKIDFNIYTKEIGNTRDGYEQIHTVIGATATVGKTVNDNIKHIDVYA